MIYVKRDAAGAIVAVSRMQSTDDDGGGAGWQACDGNDPELVAFAHSVTEAGNPLGPSDLGLVRVLEDLVDLLVDQAVIRFTDLPPAAQAKLVDRRGTRAALQALMLLDDDDGDTL